MYVNKTIKKELTPAITAGAYSAGDVVGGLLEFNFGGAGGGGTVRSVLLVDDDNQGAALTLWLFDSKPAVLADNAAFAMTVSDLKKVVGQVSLSSYVTQDSNKFALVSDVNLSFAGKLWGYLVCTATPTYVTTTGLTVAVIGWED